jgi:uncharacterized protein with NRDE domain
MCIVLLTTAHPSYALILIDNRDEYVLRPTSRPHWWTQDPPPPESTDTGPAGEAPSSPPQQILSSRDLQRPERGTWLGITRAGHVAVLTNYRDPGELVVSPRSRGAMVTAWLGAPRAQPTANFVEGMLAGDGVRGVGGFSLICGKLRRRRGGAGSGGGDGGIAPLAVLSNRAEHPDHIPWIAGGRDGCYGLSNAAFDGPEWPKVELGKRALAEAVRAAVRAGYGEEELVEALFGVLRQDTLPRAGGESLAELIPKLRETVFVPLIGDAAHLAAMAEAARADGSVVPDAVVEVDGASRELAGEERPDAQAGGAGSHGFETGMYGTQRQTVVLVDLDGNVTYVERALWDAQGRPIAKGPGDEKFRFKIEGWDEEID